MNVDSPFNVQISFKKIIRDWIKRSGQGNGKIVSYTQNLLREVDSVPVLMEGFSNVEILYDNAGLIERILAGLFAEGAAGQEMKAASIPFTNIFFNATESFRVLTGEGFTPNLVDYANVPPEEFYIMQCCMILKCFYKIEVITETDILLEIPDNKGIVRYYKLVYNSEFLEIRPAGQFAGVDTINVALLVDNYNDSALWKKHFPPNSWVLEGFALVQLVDVTTETALSRIKSIFVKPRKETIVSDVLFNSLLRSIFSIADLQVHLFLYDPSKKKFFAIPNQDGSSAESSQFLVDDIAVLRLIEMTVSGGQPYYITDTVHYAKEVNAEVGVFLQWHGISSCALTPFTRDGRVLGIGLFTSGEANQLNGFHCDKLHMLLPLIEDSIVRAVSEIDTGIDAIVQREYTSIHGSVYWKFREEVQKKLDLFSTEIPLVKNMGENLIRFEDVYPFYGQVDIKGSSIRRIEAASRDLMLQLVEVIKLLEGIYRGQECVSNQQMMAELKHFMARLTEPVQGNFEHAVTYYLRDVVHPFLEMQAQPSGQSHEIANYFSRLDTKTGLFYESRRQFDHTLMAINNNLADILDNRQASAQMIFPHYYQRYKTDGVEHTLYVGASIAPGEKFQISFVNKLRYWQLETLCEMVISHQRQSSNLDCSLEVTALVVAYDATISIRFRNDEKRFDIDSSYDAQYEVLKKRIDKAKVMGSEERLVLAGMVTIVYSTDEQQQEYLDYIDELRFKNLLKGKAEMLNVEELPGVNGLKAIRFRTGF